MVHHETMNISKIDAPRNDRYLYSSIYIQVLAVPSVRERVHYGEHIRGYGEHVRNI